MCTVTVKLNVIKFFLNNFEWTRISSSWQRLLYLASNSTKSSKSFNESTAVQALVSYSLWWGMKHLLIYYSPFVTPPSPGSSQRLDVPDDAQRQWSKEVPKTLFSIIFLTLLFEAQGSSYFSIFYSMACISPL